MFKLLISFVMLGLIFIIGYIAFRLVKEALTPNAFTPPPHTNASIDEVIEELEFKVMRAELHAEKGIKSAEETLTYLQSELVKARKIKNKLTTNK
jgi:hypothetical protein